MSSTDIEDNTSYVLADIYKPDIPESLKKALIENRYYMPKLIDGKLCALQDFFTTTGIVIGITDVGYERRYCYKSSVQAIVALSSYEDTSQHASGPWIKCKGRYNGELIDLLNPEFGNTF